MKKAILNLVVTFIATQGFAQGLELYFEGVLLSPGAEITLAGHPDSGMMVLDTLDVKNISSSTLEVKCIRTILENIDSTVNSFCWGVCYPPATDTSVLSVTIPSQGMSYEFAGDHNPSGKVGVVKVKYAFYDIHTPQSQSIVVVNYDHSQVDGVTDLPGTKFISGAYPNPADNFTSLDYDLTGSPNSQILIFNFLGKLIEKLEVGNSTGTITINTSLFNEGIYFYSLKVNNQIIKTRKLVISHR